MKLIKREQLEDNFECWDITTKEHHNFVANGAVVHNCNARFVWTEDRIWASSRTNWKAEDEKNLWWQALKQNPWIEAWCKRNEGLVVYGEVFGQVQNLKYGSKPGQVFFRVFDILHHDRWMDYDEARNEARMFSRWEADLMWVPEVYRGPFDEELITKLALDNSSFGDAGHMREGVVVKPVNERKDPDLGRVQLKIVSPRYLEKD